MHVLAPSGWSQQVSYCFRYFLSVKMALVVSMLFVFSVLFVFGRFPHKRGEGGLIKVKKQVDFNIHFR